MLAATQAMVRRNVRCHKHVCQTWIERRLGYPKFKPRNERHPNANPHEYEGVREPFPPRVRFDCPKCVHAPERDERRKGEPHEAVDIRLYHPAKCLGRIVVHGAAQRLSHAESNKVVRKVTDSHCRDHVAHNGGILLGRAVLGQLRDELREWRVIGEQGSQQISETALENVAVQSGQRGQVRQRLLPPPFFTSATTKAAFPLAGALVRRRRGEQLRVRVHVSTRRVQTRFQTRYALVIISLYPLLILLLQWGIVFEMTVRHG